MKMMFIFYCKPIILLVSNKKNTKKKFKKKTKHKITKKNKYSWQV